MIRNLSGGDNDGYVRPNDEWSLEPALAELALEDGSTEILIQRPSLRLRRKRLTIAITAFTFGAMLILMQSPVRNEFFAPGPLNSAHAQILAGEGTERCAACHTAGNQNFAQWLTAAFLPGKQVQACQSDLCMKCHAKTIDPELARMPHNVPAETLSQISAQAGYASHRPKIETAIVRGGRIECSTCHREHHGSDDLTAMTDRQCQTCHAENYHSFETDHPEFTNWPQQQRQGIAFDHVSHGLKHFAANGEEFDCKSCHVDDQNHNVQRLLPYEQSCARCHDDTIDNRSDSGIVLLQLPMLDLVAIEDQKLSIGSWPENATGDFDGQVSGLMRMLLFTDPQAAEVLARRGTEFEFADFDPDDPSDVQDAVQIAWAIKFLMHDLATGGTDELQRRLSLALDRTLSSREFESLAMGIASADFAKAANRWLPGLSTEVPLHRLQATGPDTAVFNEQLPLAYYQDESDELLAANPLKELMAGRKEPISAANPENVARSEADADRSVASTEPPAAKPDQPTVDLATANPKTPINTKSSEPPTPEIPEPTIPEEELLAANPLAELVQSQPEKIANTGTAVDEFETDQPANENSRPADVANAGTSTENESPVAPVDEKAVTRDFFEKIADDIATPPSAEPEPGFPIDEDQELQQFLGNRSVGGWVRNDRTFQISYRPQGHADLFLTAWFNMVASTPRAESRPAIQSAFAKLTSSTSIGACNYCHTVDATSNQVYAVNWLARYRDTTTRSFTKFSHGPHLLLPQLSDCSNCHRLDVSSANADSFSGFDASTAISNFAPIAKANCASCHREGGAGNGCTQCHNYHVGSKILSSQ